MSEKTETYRIVLKYTRLGESITTNPNATSEVYYCIRGNGKTEVEGNIIHWKKGDFMSVPAGIAINLMCLL